MSDAALPTWTAYPSLLSNLISEAERDALERAAAAQYCGRYRDAKSIFDSQLSASHTLPILTLQRADMLTAQGCEHERMHLLEKALKRPDLEHHPASVRLLMQLMLADAQFWARGKISMSNGPHSTPDVVELLRHTRKALEEQVNGAGIQSLSDIDVLSSLPPIRTPSYLTM